MVASPRQDEGPDRDGPPARGWSGLDVPIIRYAPWAAGVGLGLLVALAPLPFGAVEPEMVLVLRLAAAVLLVLAVPAATAGRSRMGRSGTSRSPLAPVAVPALALLAFTALGLVQAMPWPPAVAGVLSPGHAAAWAPVPGGRGACTDNSIHVLARVTQAPLLS